jgi:transposase InsO family protein
VIASLQSTGAGLPIERACQLLWLSRSDFYRKLRPAARGVDLMAAIDALVLEFPGYGYRRVTAQLQRDGWAINHKRVLRLMREAGLLCRQRRRWIRTTDSQHGLLVYPNLLAGCGWRALTAPDQAWVADLTYIRLPEAFCYLAALLDAYSRRVVGWRLAQSLDASLVLGALEGALSWRRPPTGWIHHSDRGVQYACRDYVERLKEAGAQISMTATGSPRQNAQAESFFRTLKSEEVYLADYAGFAEAQQRIRRFIDDVYDKKRLHSALGYLPPSEFEERFAAGVLH